MGSAKGDIAELLADLERKGWRVERGKYWKCYCPCPKKHLKTIHITPSDPRYVQNLRGQLKRATCWEEG